MSKISVTTIAGLTSGGDANKVKIESGDDLEVVSGDLTVDTSTLKVDSSNNRVGIGTASPATRIHIGDSGNAGEEAIQFSNNAVQGFIGIEGSSGNRFLGSAVDNMFIGTTTADGLELATNNNVRMKIDADGRVTTPNQPLAVAYYNSNSQDGAYNATNRNNIIHKPGATRMNFGNLYDTSNGRFTAPIAGRYYIAFAGSQYTNNVSSYFLIRFLINGTAEKDVYSNKQGTWHHLSGYHVFNCAANDYMEIKSIHDSSTDANRGGFDVNTYTNFICYLLT